VSKARKTVIIGAGDLWATTHDLGHWDTALAAPGLLRAESLQAMFTPHAAVPMAFVQDFFVELTKVCYGYGWFLGEMEGHRLRLTAGNNAGFRSNSLQLPDRDGLIVLLSNDAHSRLTQISRQLVTVMLADPGSPGSTHP
jgi:CubicO group peptidase (beta-lactamase class C family)